jgi:hypothetical protein
MVFQPVCIRVSSQWSFNTSDLPYFNLSYLRVAAAGNIYEDVEAQSMLNYKQQNSSYGILLPVLLWVHADLPLGRRWKTLKEHIGRGSRHCHV